MATNGTDQALALVQDAKKFEAKLKELAKAEDGAKKAQAKARSMMKDAQKQVDDARAEATKIMADAKGKAEGQMKSVEAAMVDVKKREAAAVAKENKVQKAETKLAQDRNASQALLDGFAEKEKALEERIKSFEGAVKSLCASA